MTLTKKLDLKEETIFIQSWEFSGQEFYCGSIQGNQIIVHAFIEKSMFKTLQYYKVVFDRK